MTSKEVLFVRNAEDGTDQDAWNDDVLIALYDKALKVAKKEVAQRIAMETNSKSSNSNNVDEGKNDCGSSNKSLKKNKKKGSKSSLDGWKQGQNCRAIYTEDGFEYEATIKKILDNETCIVKYIGYGNEEIQPLSDLRPSGGKDEIIQQKARAAVDGTEENGACGGTASDDEQLEENFYNKSNRANKKRSPNFYGNYESVGGFNFTLPGFPHTLSHGLEANGITPPPPTPFLFQEGLSEDKSLYPMLVSWYMSGYYTGVYHGQRMQRQSGSKNN